jgi:epoxyqueuosine reductase QueG
MEMTKDKISSAPSKLASSEIYRTYYELGRIVNVVSNQLRQMGHNAQAGPALGGDVNYPILAENAGLGVVGKHGLLIDPKVGPSLRIATIYTDIENLPFSTSNDHLWVKSFCDKCQKCVRLCPAAAIYSEAKLSEHATKVCIDYKKCAVPFSKDFGCTLCVKNCTFYSGDYQIIKESICTHS